MRTRTVEPPAAEPVSLAEARRHLRVDLESPEEDALILGLVRAARESIESHVRRALMPRVLESSFVAFPAWSCEPLALPRAPVVAVESVAYLDPAGEERTLDPSAYRLVEGDGAELVPAVGGAWPATAACPDAVRVRYAAGYADADAVPAAAKQALLLRVGTLYEHREQLVVGSVAELSETEKWLLAPLEWGAYP